MLHSSSQCSHCFHELSWLAKLEYLADVFSHLNGLIISLQRKTVSVFKVKDKIRSMIKKTGLWSRRLNHSNYVSFSGLSGIFLVLSELRFPDKVKSDICEYFKASKYDYVSTFLFLSQYAIRLETFCEC
jgi:hypothetical protein